MPNRNRSAVNFVLQHIGRLRDETLDAAREVREMVARVSAEGTMRDWDCAVIVHWCRKQVRRQRVE